MKHSLLTLAAALAIAGCASPNPDASPAQKAINATATSCKDIDAAIVATDAAIKTNALKGSNADAAVKALPQAMAGCNAAAAAVQAAAAASAPASAPK